MRRPRIAIVGDIHQTPGALADAGAIAVELAARWSVDVGIRSVADSATAWECFDRQFGAIGVTSWLTIRDPAISNQMRASIHMGDQLNIDELFTHDLVIIACRDAALRRFLADLPVHTYPGVSQLAVLLTDTSGAGERIEDLTRFDAIVGPEEAYTRIAGPSPEAQHPLMAMSSVIHATNTRAVVSCGKRGDFACLLADGKLLQIPAPQTSQTAHERATAAFIGAIAAGMAQRLDWETIGREAVRCTDARVASSRHRPTD